MKLRNVKMSRLMISSNSIFSKPTIVLCIVLGLLVISCQENKDESPSNLVQSDTLSLDKSGTLPDADSLNQWIQNSHSGSRRVFTYWKDGNEFVSNRLTLTKENGWLSISDTLGGRENIFPLFPIAKKVDYNYVTEKLNSLFPPLLGYGMTTSHKFDSSSKEYVVEHVLIPHAEISRNESENIIKRRIWKISLNENRIELVQNDTSHSELIWPYIIK